MNSLALDCVSVTRSCLAWIQQARSWLRTDERKRTHPRAPLRRTFERMRSSEGCVPSRDGMDQVHFWM